MAISGLAWRVRDALIDGVLRSGGAVLNAADGGVRGEAGSEPGPEPGPEPGALAEQLRAEALTLRAEALGEDGLADYSRVVGSEGYARFREGCTARLRAVELASVGSREERLAFWINVYNALTIDGAIAYGLVGSTKRAGLRGFYRRTAYEVGGLRFSLDDVEHGVLRANQGFPWLPGPQFRAGDARLAAVVGTVDPRIHFALNCGAASCPPIRAYQAGAIQDQLEQAAAAFLLGEEGIRVDREARRVELPQLMRWFASDFGGRRGAITFAAGFLEDEEERALLMSGKVRVGYRSYDSRAV